MSAPRACPACGHPVPQEDTFCGACGVRLPPQGSAPRADALIGRVVDSRFRLQRLIGSGGMGAVYLAEHVGIGKQVAIKVLRADLRGQPELMARFRREAMAVSKLTDPHTITVFDFGVWRGLIYLVMEYLRGVDLATLIEPAARLPVADALDVALATLSSLAEAHAKGIVHRDLKPENIFVSRSAGGDALVKVLDFGLAKVLPGADLRSDIGYETRDGAVVGTPDYMAPEQIRGHQVDGRCDLYALGALLYRLLTGRPPYADPNPIRVFEAHLEGEIPSLAATAPELSLPPGLEPLIRGLLAVDPADRPPDALTVIEQIHALGVPGIGHRSSLAPLPAPQPPAPTPRDTFSTSRLTDAPRPAASEPAEEALATRKDIEAYEARLGRQQVLRQVLLLLGLVAGLGIGVWFLIERPAPPLTAELEPNNEPAEANPLTAGIPLRGHLGARQHPDRSDRDVYRLAIPGGTGRLTVTLTGVPGLDLILEGFDADGKKLFEINDHGPGEGESRAGLPVAIDPLYLSVREVWIHGQPPTENSTDAYTLTASLDP